MRLGIVTSFFNPCGYTRIRRNYEEFVEALGEHAQHLLTAELVLDDDRPLDCLRVRLSQRGKRPDHCMWQKESLLNAAWCSLPDEYDAVAWVDCDVLFPCPDWYDMAVASLRQHRVVQLFDYCSWRSADKSRELYRRRGIAACRRTGTHAMGAWGLGWAARRDDVSLFDPLVSGGADVFMGKIWMGEHPRNLARATALIREYDAWANAQKCRVLRDVSFLPLDVQHMFHGARENRRYVYRDGILPRHRFDPRKELVRDGATYRWSDPESPVAKEVRTWFETRREDA